MMGQLLRFRRCHLAGRAVQNGLELTDASLQLHMLNLFINCETVGINIGMHDAVDF